MMMHGKQALQQAFLSAWRDVRDFPAGTSFSTWLYRIAMNTALAQRRRERGRPSYSLEPLLPAFDRAGRLVASKGRWRDVRYQSIMDFVEDVRHADRPARRETLPLRSVRDAVQQAQRDEIVRALSQAGRRVGGPDGAAARLGLKRTTLIARMKKLGIESRCAA